MTVASRKARSGGWAAGSLFSVWGWKWRRILAASASSMRQVAPRAGAAGGRRRLELLSLVRGQDDPVLAGELAPRAVPRPSRYEVEDERAGGRGRSGRLGAGRGERRALGALDLPDRVLHELEEPIGLRRLG